MEGGRRKIQQGIKAGGEEVCVDQRVVWLHDNQQDFGWVLWTGKLTNHDGVMQWMVGVELDRPIGNDNHRIGGRTLFDCKPNHAQLIPASHLLKAEDFIAAQTESKYINTQKVDDKIESLPLRNTINTTRQAAHLTTKSDNPLGSTDMNNISHFHTMAYEQLISQGSGGSSGNGGGPGGYGVGGQPGSAHAPGYHQGTGPPTGFPSPIGPPPGYSQGGPSAAFSQGVMGGGYIPPPPGNYTKLEEWELLPHMIYSGHRNILASNKESLHDIRPRGRDRTDRAPKQMNKPVEKKNNKWKESSDNGHQDIIATTRADIISRADSNGIRRQDNTSGIRQENGGRSKSSELPATEKNIQGIDDLPINPLYNLSLQGIDQLEVVSDGEGSVYETPEGSSNAAAPVDEEDLDIGSMVEVVIKEVPSFFMQSSSYYHINHSGNLRFGVIRWIGCVPGDKKEGRKVSGVEMEDIEDGLSDGTFSGKRYFSCAPGKALFVPLRMCHKDSRFLESVSSNPRASMAFGSMDCQPVGGSVAPPSSIEQVQAMFGKNRGIQGHQNSCYLDATLFSMFAFTSVFDSLLFRPATEKDIREYNDVQRVLREEIVNPLRANLFVRADRIMKLRTMLDNLSSVRGLTTEEKDPEEFLQSLLAQILQAEPLLQLSSGHEAYHYQLFVEKDEKINLPSVQTLFDQSFLTSDIKLKQVPSCLIIQMPRFGKDYKMYQRILPSMVLDVTDVIENSPRQCIICGKLAEYECRECFGHCGSGLESIAFCPKCMEKVHSHKKRGSHQSTRKLKIPPEFQMLADHCGTIPRVYMELFAVVCIETSHYVAFTRCGSGPDATWCFFDSMADRKGEQHGYNIPRVTECGDLMQWVGEEGSQMLHALTDNKALPDLPRRLLCDAYMCFYHSPKVAMYR